MSSASESAVGSSQAGLLGGSELLTSTICRQQGSNLCMLFLKMVGIGTLRGRSVFLSFVL